MTTPEEYMGVIDEVRDRFVNFLRDHPCFLETDDWRKLSKSFIGMGKSRPTDAQCRAALFEAKKIVAKEFPK